MTSNSQFLDQEAFEALYLAVETSLYNVVYRWVWQEAEAMDIVQDAFTRLWAVRDKVRTDDARAYVYRIALNRAANVLRSRKLWRWVTLAPLAGLAAAENSAEKLLRDERERAVRAAVEALPEKNRRVLLLCRFAEMSYQEVASVLGIPEGTVASRHHTALALLKKKLDHLELSYEVTRYPG